MQKGRVTRRPTTAGGRRTFALVAVVAAAGLASSACFGSSDPDFPVFTLFSTTAETGGSSVPDTLITVDWSAGSQRRVGEVGRTPEAASLTWDTRTGFLYGVGVASPSAISRIDPLTGAATVIATAAQDVLAVAASPTGRLYALLASWTLVTVDPVSGAISDVGQVPISTQGYAWTFVSGMDFQLGGTLYAVIDQREAADPSLSVYHLLTIDPATALVTSSVEITTPFAIGDIACAPDGYIYATNSSWLLTRIDPTTRRNAFVGFGQLGALGGLAVKW
jgi:hypothetical protein